MHSERVKYMVLYVMHGVKRDTEGRLFRHKLAEVISHNRLVYGNLTVQQADGWIKAEKIKTTPRRGRRPVFQS